MAKEDEAEGVSDDSWIEQPEFLVPRFNTAHSLVQSQVEYGDIGAARQNYQKLLSLYDELNMSNIPAKDKQASYRKLMEVFSSISSADSSPKSSIMNVGKYLFPISLLVIVLLIIIFARPEFTMTGLSVFSFGENHAPEWVGGSAEISVAGKTTMNLDAYFKDRNWDAIDYSVTQAPNLNINVDKNILTITPEIGLEGTRVVYIVASDGIERSRVALTLKIK